MTTTDDTGAPRLEYEDILTAGFLLQSAAEDFHARGLEWSAIEAERLVGILRRMRDAC